MFIPTWFIIAAIVFALFLIGCIIWLRTEHNKTLDDMEKIFKENLILADELYKAKNAWVFKQQKEVKAINLAIGIGKTMPKKDDLSK